MLAVAVAIGGSPQAESINGTTIAAIKTLQRRRNAAVRLQAGTPA
jgi:hypothetical protein